MVVRVTPRAKLRAQRKWRRSMQNKGFKQVSLWLPKKYAHKIRLFAEKLRQGESALRACRRAFAAKAKIGS